MQAGAVIGVLLLAALAGDSDAFDRVYAGDVIGPRPVQVAGRIKTGINDDVIEEIGSTAQWPRCIALLLTRGDRKRAKLAEGRTAIVTGRTLFVGDLNQIAPNGHATINGRVWAGTACRSEMVIFVTRMDVLDRARRHN